ncbi:MAG: HAD family hydrolase [Chloroflexota bacterium]|jgi:HAD superfamily hydrolase (TIGR01662 family)
MIRVVLFDLGSTLIYFAASWQEVIPRASLALAENLIQHGLPLRRESFVAAFLRRIQEYYLQRESEFIEYTTLSVLRDLLAEQGYPAVEPFALRRALDCFYAVSQAHWQVEDDAHPALQALRRAGYRLGMISNAGDALDVHALIDNAALRDYFDLILISAELGIRKPHPRIFRVALDHFQVNPRQAVMVGDTLGADVLGANGVGMASIWITRRAATPDNRDHLDTIQPSAVVATLAEIPAVLQGWSTSPSPDSTA